MTTKKKKASNDYDSSYIVLPGTYSLATCRVAPLYPALNSTFCPTKPNL